MRGIYLSLATMGFSEGVRLILTNEYQYTKGMGGLEVPSLFGIAGSLPYYYYTLAVFAVSVFILYKLLDSRLGVLLRAVRENEEAASAMGVDTKYVKTVAFTVSAFYGGLGGALYAHYTMVITPGMASLSEQSLVLVMTIVGGYGSFLGPIVGAFIVWTLSIILTTSGLLGYHLIVFALAVIVIEILTPGGLVGMMRKPAISFLHQLKKSLALEAAVAITPKGSAPSSSSAREPGLKCLFGESCQRQLLRRIDILSTMYIVKNVI